MRAHDGIGGSHYRSSRGGKIREKGSTIGLFCFFYEKELGIFFQFSFESLFRSLNYALLDNACREYLFIVDFFTVNGDDALALFNAIFGRTLQILQVNNSKKRYFSSFSSLFHVRKIWRITLILATTLLEFFFAFTSAIGFATSCIVETFPLSIGSRCGMLGFLHARTHVFVFLDTSRRSTRFFGLSSITSSN